MIMAATPQAVGQSPSPLPATEESVSLTGAVVPFLQGFAIDPTDPDVMYWAAADIGVMKSVDGGATWGAVNDGLPSLYTSALAMHPDDPNHLMVGFHANFLAQGPRPYRSLDGGARWEPTVVCEREDGLENLRQLAAAERLVFDPTAPSRFYYLVHSCCVSCGGFYRSCDMGASYDPNPRCPAAAVLAMTCGPEPQPVNNISSNDASILQVHPTTGDLFGTTGLHPEESALMTSADKGGYWTWEDVLDTVGTFVDPNTQGVSSLFLEDLALAPSDGDIRYGSLNAGSVRCSDGKAYPQAALCPASSLPQRNLVARWFGETSDATECAGTNDCDGEPAPDRIWRPIFDFDSFPDVFWVAPLLVSQNNPDRLFVAVNGLTSYIVMLTPPVPGDPAIAPWDAEILHSDPEHFFQALVQDPADSNRFYAVSRTRTRSNPSPRIRLQTLSTKNNWNTSQRTVLFETRDLFRVYDLAQTVASGGAQIAAGTSLGLYVSHDMGDTWIKPDPLEIQVAALAVSPSNPERVFTKRTESIQIGLDGFEGVVDMETVLDRSSVMCTNVFHDLEVDPDNAAILYVSTGAGIWRHGDTRVPADAMEFAEIGLEWEEVARVSEGLADEYIWSLAFDPLEPSHDRVLAGSRGGEIYESLDRGGSWSSMPVQGAPGVKDVRDIQFAGGKAFAATSLGVLSQPGSGLPWGVSFTGDRVARIAPGVTGIRRVYAAGENGLYRTLDGGATWEDLQISAQPPYSAVMETVGRDGRHHLWVTDNPRGLHRLSSTLVARPGPDIGSVVLEWTGSAPSTQLQLFYGRDADLLDGTDAVEGASPIALGQVTSTTLSGLDLRSAPLHVALKNLEGPNEPPRLGLPLSIDFDYVFSPELAASAVPASCPPAVLIQWDRIPEAQSYILYRSENGPSGPFERLATLGSFEELHHDLTAIAGSPYWYVMTAIIEEEETSGRNIVTATAVADGDLDGFENCSDNCPASANATQDDGDGDGAGDACDCRPMDETLYGTPTVVNLRFHADMVTLEWQPGENATPGTLYDVIRGVTHEAPVGSGPSETCLESSGVSTTTVDTETPLLDTSFYYLVRGTNPCGTGTYGAESSTIEQVSSACP